MKQKVLLITWGTWYIGSHAVVAFEQAGYQTVIIDNLINSSKDVLLWIESILWYLPIFYEMDISDKKRVSEIFEKYHFDGVVHFAGLKSVAESCQYPFLYHENNIVWSMYLFEVMQKFWVKNIVFSSSATVYDASNTSPFREQDIIWSANPYGTTKIVLEKLLQDYSRFSQWKVISLRYFNPIGAHPSGSIWEKPPEIPPNILPYIFKVASGRLPLVKIFWSDYPTPDGTGVRDYVDINDLANAHILAYKKLENSESMMYTDINIGTGKPTSVLELIQAVEAVTNVKISYEFAPRRSGDIANAYADVSLWESYLGFQSQVPLQESLKNAWDFIQKKK